MLLESLLTIPFHRFRLRSRVGLLEIRDSVETNVLPSLAFYATSLNAQIHINIDLQSVLVQARTHGCMQFHDMITPARMPALNLW